MRDDQDERPGGLADESVDKPLPADKEDPAGHQQSPEGLKEERATEKH